MKTARIPTTRDSSENEKDLHSLRIKDAEEVDFDALMFAGKPVTLSEFQSVGDLGQTAVYVYLDVNNLPSSPRKLAPQGAGALIVHLANSGDLDAKLRRKLTDWLDKLIPARSTSTVQDQTILLLSGRVLNSLGYPLSEDRSFEAFADECMKTLAPKTVQTFWQWCSVLTT